MLVTHMRRMSAPFCLMTSCAERALPDDFESFSPFSLTMKPQVTTFWYGAAPSRPVPTSSDDWNQPRCWSCPSMYIAAGQVSSSRERSTARCEQPESNQTSRMSFSLRQALLPHLEQV